MDTDPHDSKLLGYFQKYCILLGYFILLQLIIFFLLTMDDQVVPVTVISKSSPLDEDIRNVMQMNILYKLC